jgi:hypothetical protein
MTKAFMPTIYWWLDSAEDTLWGGLLQRRKRVEASFTSASQEDLSCVRILNQEKIRMIFNKDVAIMSKTMNRNKITLGTRNS